MAKTKPMSRSRTQIASAYAPESFFTYEGGLGACIAKSIRSAEAELLEATKSQIFERLDDLAGLCSAAAVTCRDPEPQKPRVLAKQCVEMTFLNAARDGYEIA